MRHIGFDAEGDLCSTASRRLDVTLATESVDCPPVCGQISKLLGRGGGGYGEDMGIDKQVDVNKGQGYGEVQPASKDDVDRASDQAEDIENQDGADTAGPTEQPSGSH